MWSWDIIKDTGDKTVERIGKQKGKKKWNVYSEMGS